MQLMEPTKPAAARFRPVCGRNEQILADKNLCYALAVKVGKDSRHDGRQDTRGRN
jgi:hypothetical protein